MLASVYSTYSKIGKTPVIKNACRYTHLSIASAICPDGRFIYIVRKNSFDGEAIVLFLEKVLMEIKQKVTIIWDGAKIHSCQAVKDFLEKQETGRIWLVKIPPYSPELNADEQVWNYIKNVEMKNVCCKSMSELQEKAVVTLESLKEKKEIIQSFFRHPKVRYY